MRVLVDTTIWSLALRRGTENLSPTEKEEVEELRRLVDETRAVMIGPVRQEVLSGIAGQRQFDQLRELLAPFDDLPLERETYELAAQLYNRCRKKGVQGSHVDFLICAAALKHGSTVFSSDRDFLGYARHCKIGLHKPRRV